jgi:hypothetical protein
MPEYRVNDSAARQARQLIDDGRFDDRTEWSDAAPDAAAANDVIEQEGFDAFAAWHLAEDPDASEGTKGRYAFPYGERPTAGSARRHRESGRRAAATAGRAPGGLTTPTRHGAGGASADRELSSGPAPRVGAWSDASSASRPSTA